MNKDMVIEKLTKALVNARSSLIFIYREISMQDCYNSSCKEAEMAIIALESALYESLLQDKIINDLMKEDLKH